MFKIEKVLQLVASTAKQQEYELHDDERGMPSAIKRELAAKEKFRQAYSSAEQNSPCNVQTREAETRKSIVTSSKVC